MFKYKTAQELLPAGHTPYSPERSPLWWRAGRVGAVVVALTLFSAIRSASILMQVPLVASGEDGVNVFDNTAPPRPRLRKWLTWIWAGLYPTARCLFLSPVAAIAWAWWGWNRLPVEWKIFFLFPFLCEENHDSFMCWSPRLGSVAWNNSGLHRQCCLQVPLLTVGSAFAPPGTLPCPRLSVALPAKQGQSTRTFGVCKGCSEWQCCRVVSPSLLPIHCLRWALDKMSIFCFSCR